MTIHHDKLAYGKLDTGVEELKEEDILKMLKELSEEEEKEESKEKENKNKKL